MPGYVKNNKTSVSGGSVKKTKVSKVSKAKKSNKSKKVKRGGRRCGSYHAQHMNGGASCGSHKRMNGGFIRDGSPQNLMMRVSDKKKCKN